MAKARNIRKFNFKKILLCCTELCHLWFTEFSSKCDFFFLRSDCKNCITHCRVCISVTLYQFCSGCWNFFKTTSYTNEDLKVVLCLNSCNTNENGVSEKWNLVHPPSSKALQCLEQAVLSDFPEAQVNPFYCQPKIQSIKTNLC